MARAMRGSGPWNPNAILVSSRILVFVDSMSPWERPCSRLASIAARCFVILLARLTNDGRRERRAHDNHLSSASVPLGPFDREHEPEAFFEEVRPPQSRVGLRDPVQLFSLTHVEIAGVLPQRVARSRDVAGVAERAASPAW